MSGNEAINQADLATLAVVRYPDRVLRKPCAKVEDPADPAVAGLVERMFELMFASHGIGLAAPQVGINASLFVASPSFEPSDLQVFINPELSDFTGKADAEEGCLSFPGIFCKVTRPGALTVEADGLDGKRFSRQVDELTARVIQHENDHLNGKLLVDRMSTVAKFANRKALKQLEEEFTG